jgi:hypothetical protein
MLGGVRKALLGAQPLENTTSTEQQMAVLSHELGAAKVRFERWLAVCFALSIGVSLLALFTKSVFFFVIAGLGWFFVWNRWKCRAFVSALSSQAAPSNDEERTRWVNAVTNSLLHPPSWWNLSENISGAILIALFAVVTFFIVSSTGLWMRILYAIAWGLLVLHVVRRIKYARTRRLNGPSTP